MKWRNIPRNYRDRLAELTEQLSRDPYAVLGITEEVTDEEVKQAYRKLVSAYHPDKQGVFLRVHAQEVIKIVNAAYERICAMRNL
ncbi:MAG: Chaperone protein DnaJ [Gammaproteobacteria bacterium]|nr:Chaperone protein DnaJ [Gammaproteobacteria bacterium]